MKKVCIIFVLIAVVTAGFMTYKNKMKKSQVPIPQISRNDKEIKLDIMTTNKLLYFMTKDIVKNKHNVDYMFKDENEQWNFEFTDDSLKNISRKDLFIYTGAEFEPWIDDFLGKLNQKNVGVINASRGANLTTYTKKVQYKNTFLDENPYYWMNINNYKTALSNIASAVSDKDPKNRDYYSQNFSNCLKKLNLYEKQFKELSDKLGNYTFVVADDKLDYFIKYNGFKVVKINKDDKADLNLKDSDKPVFLYDDETELSIYSDIIKSYNMKTANIIEYKYNFKYSDVLDYDIQSLSKILK